MPWWGPKKQNKKNKQKNPTAAAQFAATAQIQSLAQEFLYAMCVAIKRKKKSFPNLHSILSGKSNTCPLITSNSQRFLFSYWPLVPTEWVQLDGSMSKYTAPFMDSLLLCSKLLIYGVYQNLLKVQDDGGHYGVQRSLQKCTSIRWMLVISALKLISAILK